MKKSKQDQNTSTLFSRREFIRNSVLTFGAASALSAVNALPVKAATASSKLSLIVSGYKLDRIEALIDGRVQVEGCDINFEESGIGDINTNVLSGPQTLDVTEIGLHPFMLAYANEGFRDYSLLPIFKKYRDDIEFMMIYVREAHPTDKWWLAETKFMRLIM